MIKKLHQFVFFALPVLLVISSMGFSSPNGTGDLQQRSATIQGDYDFHSDETVTVIVELEEPSIVEAKHQGKKQSKSKLSKARNEVKESVISKTSNSKVNREYDYLFSGFSIEVKQSELKDLALTEGIKAIYPNVRYQVDAVKSYEVNANEVSPEMIDSAPYIGANDAWNELGITGEGITVGIIDTGIDYTHPDLAHAFGDYKGYSFVEDVADPMDDHYHGTHVAGTVAANGLIKGVAPNASLLGYRVLGTDGSGTTEDVVAGIERAVQDGVDVMNLSLGNSLNNADWATSIALDWAMAEGVVAVTSNGNSGPSNWTVGSPGTSRDAISVGASQLPYNVFNSGVFTSEGVDYPSSAVLGHASDEALLSLTGETFEYVYVGLGSESEFADVDVDGKIALISRGQYPFVDKATNAANAGAVGAIIFNNVAGDIPYYIPGMAVPTLKLDDVDGQKMLTELENGNNEVTFDIEFDREVGETIADFSSRGPVYETWMIKPDVAAPGVDIISTIPGGFYASLQGTSMAAPHVAGAAALLLEKSPNMNSFEIKSALMNTADPLFDENGNPYPLNTQGAGGIRVMDALQAEALVAPGSYSFGVFEKNNGKEVERQHFEITNLSNKKKTYDMSVEVYDGDQHINITTSNNLKIEGNSTKPVNMRVQVDTEKLDTGYYEGMITLSNGDEVIEVPTILFIQEPDFPHVMYSGVTTNDDNSADIFVHLNRDVDFIDLYIVDEDVTYIVGYATSFEDLSKGENMLHWDGNIDLPPGTYNLYAFVGKDGYSTEQYVFGEYVRE